MHVDDSCIVSSDAIAPRRNAVVADVIEQDTRVFFDDELGTHVGLVAGFHFGDDVMYASVVTIAGARVALPVSRLRITREKEVQS